MSKQHDLTPPAEGREVDAFLDRVSRAPAVKRAGARGRLLFAMDATASRGPTWERASQTQAEMFRVTGELGGLAIQLCYYRGLGELRATRWLTDAEALARHMGGVRCLGGLTQIGKVLRHAIAESERERVHALVFVGDCMEEDVDRLADLAGRLGLLGVPAFVFHEGYDVTARRAFEQIARLTGGAYCPFDAGSPNQLRDLLAAVAVYAAGGRAALEDFGRRRGGVALRLTHGVKKG